MSNVVKDDFANIRETSNITMPNKNQLYSSFNRFKLKYPGEELDTMHGLLFFTKPDCYFYEKYSNATTFTEDIQKTYQFNDLMKFKPRTFQNLQADQGGGDFITPFYNEFDSIDINDRVIKTRDSVETANDWKTVYGHKMNDSLGAGTFNVSFRDNRNKIIFDILEAWILYIDLITKGFIKPYRGNRDDKILDYACSAYYFVVSEDFMSILYYCKFVGVFPLNIPDSAFTGGSTKLDYNIQFQYSYKDPSPGVITDFNSISNYHNTKAEYPLFKDGMMQSTWVTMPYIEVTETGNKLKWIK